MASKKKVWAKVVDDRNSATSRKNKRGGGGDNIGRATQSFPLTPPAPLNRLFGNDGDSAYDLDGDDIHGASSWLPPTYGNDTQDMTCDTMGAPPNAESGDQRNTTPANGGDQAPKLVEVDASTADSMARRNKSDMRSSDSEGTTGRTRGRSLAREREARASSGESFATGRTATRLRHPRDPASPETANAVQAYLSPTLEYHNSDGGNSDRSRRHTRSLSPTAGQHRSRWCSPTAPASGPGNNNSVHGSSGVAGAGTVSSSPKTGVAEKGGVPPLLLAPSEWGIGLGGEWVSARGTRMVRASGRVSLTWSDIRGNTLLHLAAQHNDIALAEAVLECEERRKRALEKRDRRRERVLERARRWNERTLKEAADGKLAVKPPTLKNKDILKRIKQERAEQEKTTNFGANTPSASAGAGVPGVPGAASGGGGAGSSNKHAEELSTQSASANGDSGNDSLIECEDWLPLLPSRAARHDGDSGSGDHSVGDARRRRGEGGDLSSSRRRGAAVVEALRAVLEEAHIRQVVRLAGMYLEGNMNEAEWYHRTGAILPTSGSMELLVKIAAAHPSDTFRRKQAKAAIQDYAEEERSTAEGGYWMDRGIKDALDLNARNRLTETPLILGAQNASIEVVAALLEEPNTDIVAVNEDGCTALVLAAMLDKTEVVKVLVAAYVARGQGVDHRTVNGFSALHWAVVRGNPDITVDLVDAGAAINTGRTEPRQALWRLPIHKCAEYGSTGCLEILLKAGADPNVEDKLGMTAMHIAASAGFLEIMRILAAGGEDKASAVSVNIVSKKHGKTPLHYAVESLQLDVVRFILGRERRGGDGSGIGNDPKFSEREKREAEGIKHLDASQRTKLEVMLDAAAKEERGVIASGIASISEFVQQVFL